MTSSGQDRLEEGTEKSASGELTTNPSDVRPGRYELDSDHGKISWFVSHLGFSTYIGHFTDVSATLHLDPAKPDQSKLSAKVATASVSTCHRALDEHLRGADFLDVDSHPEAFFESRTLRLLDRHNAEIDGLLTLNGKTNPVTISASFNLAGICPVDGIYTVGFDGQAIINRCDFGIAHMFPPLGDKVTLRLEAEFKAV